MRNGEKKRYSIFFLFSFFCLTLVPGLFVSVCQGLPHHMWTIHLHLTSCSTTSSYRFLGRLRSLRLGTGILKQFYLSSVHFTCHHQSILVSDNYYHHTSWTMEADLRCVLRQHPTPLYIRTDLKLSLEVPLKLTGRASIVETN